MKSLVGIVSLFLILIVSIYPMAMAQNMTNNSIGKGNYSGGGMSTKSVDIAKSNTTNLTPNTIGKGNYSGGGMSTKSVDIAKSNTTHP
ncbi:MAG: hypothetical protein ABJB76_02900 [Candidatus Nitrosocosmicus sp.]